MITVKKEKYGNVIEGYVVVKIRAFLKQDDERTEIPEKEAGEMLDEKLEMLASSNDGSEALANSKVYLHEPITVKK